MMSDKKKAFFFALNLFIIVAAYYQLKPLSRSLFVTYLGSKNLPYVWITTTIILLVLLPFFHWRLKRFAPQVVVNASCISFIVLMMVFRYALANPSPKIVVGFYVLTDIYSVVLIESFWSLTNSAFRLDRSARWYGLVGSGGLIGGTFGGFLASGLLEIPGFTAINLLYVAVGIVGILLVLNSGIFKYDTHDAIKVAETDSTDRHAGRPRIFHSLLVIAAIMFLAQIVEPVVEYQFLNTVEHSISELNERTSYISWFMSAINVVALLVNLLFTPFIHRFAGIFAGLYTQPLTVAAGALAFILSPTLLAVSLLKLADRSLSYSLTRSSKELLYVPFEPVQIHKAKIWIDLFGYRVFKIFGAISVLILTQWIASPLNAVQLSWLLLVVAALWLVLVKMLKTNYAALDMLTIVKKR